MDLENMSLEKLLERREKLDEKRRAIKEEGAELTKLINKKLEEEQADYWGVTVEEYKAAKEEANPSAKYEREYHALLTQQRKLNARADDTRKAKDVRAAAREEADSYGDKLSKLAGKLEEAEKERKPLQVVLNMVRARKAKAARQAQVAKPVPVSNTTEAK